MKKEKRELTIEQLEKKAKVAAKIVSVAVITYLFSLILIMVLFFAFLVLGNTKATITKATIYTIFGNCVIFLFVFLLIIVAREIETICSEEICSKQRQIEIEKMKIEAKKGNLQNFVDLVDEDIIEYILSRSIEKVEIDMIDGLYFLTTIQLDDNKQQDRVYIPIKEFISIIDENSKKKMLESIIQKIELKNFRGKKEFVIRSPEVVYVEGLEDEDELLEIFKLKE